MTTNAKTPHPTVLFGRQLAKSFVHFRVDVGLGLDEVSITGGDARLNPIIDGGIEMRDVAVTRQKADERHEVGALKSIFVQITGMSIRGGDDDDPVLPQFAEKPL